MAILDNVVEIDYTVNPRIINIKAPTTNITIQDLYDTLMFLQSQYFGIDEPNIAGASGLEPLGGGVKVGLTMTLYDAFVKFEDRLVNTTCKIDGGNLVSQNTVTGEFYETPLAFSNNVNAIYTTSSSATQADLEAIQYSSFQNSVWVDTDTLTTGTLYPSGTREFPVNNIGDAVDIAHERGFDTIQLLNSVTIDGSYDLEKFRLIGRNPNAVIIDILDEANVSELEIHNCCVKGTLDGGTTLKECVTYDLRYVNGFITDCLLMGDLYLDGDEQVNVTDCSCGEVTGYQTIDMGGSGQDCVFRNFNGKLIIKNLHDSENTASLFFNSGSCIIDSTVSSGTVEVRGVFDVEDNSTGDAIVITDIGMGETSPSEKSAEYAGYVVVDFDNGVNGNMYPTGTNYQPVNNFTDAKLIAEDLHIKNFIINSDVVLDADIPDYTLKGHNYEVVDMNGYDCDMNIFEQCNVTGIQKADTVINIQRARFHDIIDFRGIITDSFMLGFLRLADVGHSNLKNVTTKGYENVIDYNNNKHDIFLSDFNGLITIMNINSPFDGQNPTAICNIISNSVINIDASCIMGYIRIGGNFVVNNYSTSPYLIFDDTKKLLSLEDTKTIGEATWDIDPEDPKYSDLETSNMGTYLHAIKVWVNGLRRK